MQVLRTGTFDQWILHLRDREAKARINGRLRRLQEGNPGKTQSVGSGIVELKVDFGPGYRVYYVHRGDTVVVLLCGGDKGSQDEDIKRAKKLAALLDKEML